MSRPAQCVYAAVTLTVYVGGMAGDLSWMFGKQASGQMAAFTGIDQLSHTVKQQRPQCAASEQQPVLEASGKAPATVLREPEAEEDEDWELLAASDPKSSLQPLTAQQGAAVDGAVSGHSFTSGLSDGPARAANLTGTSGDIPSIAKGALKLDSTQSGAPKTAGRYSRGVHEGVMDMHAETEAGSLLFPRSASAAAQLSKGLDMQASDSREKSPYEQPSDEQQQDKLRRGGQQRNAAAAAAFDDEEVLWRCTIFTVQVLSFSNLVLSCLPYSTRVIAGQAHQKLFVYQAGSAFVNILKLSRACSTLPLASWVACHIM